MLCLRRTKLQLDGSNLKVDTELIALRLSQTEQSLYNKLLEETKRDMDTFVGRKFTVQQRYTRLFTAILRLRMLCDQGTFCVRTRSSLSPMPYSLLGSSTGFMLESDFSCDFYRSDESIEMTKDGEFCSNSSRPLFQPCVNYDTPDSRQESPERTPLSLHCSICLSAALQVPTVVRQLDNRHRSALHHQKSSPQSSMQ